MMKAASKYDYDIFISYAHVDNEPFMGITHGWVTNLFKALTTALSAKISSVNITSRWPGVQSQPHAPSSSQIEDYLDRSALLLIIFSPGYLSSELCKQELDIFLQKRESDSDRQIFIVEKTAIRTGGFPDNLAHFPRYPFWVRDERKRPRTLAIPQPDPRDARFYQKVDDLARDLRNALETMRQPAATNKLTQAPPLATVFLAQVTHDLLSERDGVKRSLEQLNVRILPDHHRPMPVLDSSTLEQLLSESDLFVQILSGESATAGHEQEINQAEEQYRAAVDRNIPIEQWRPLQLNIQAVADTQQKMLLELPTVNAMNLEEFKLLIRQRITEKPKAPGQKESFVFLNATYEDQRLATKVGSIIGQWGLLWHLRLNRGKPPEVRKTLTKEFSSCDALIVFYGEVGAVWVKRQFDYFERVRLPSLPEPVGLYKGPPEEKTEVKIPDYVSILDCRRGIDEVELRTFLKPLLEENIV